MSGYARGATTAAVMRWLRQPRPKCHGSRCTFDRPHDLIDFSMQDARNVETPYAEYFAPYRNYTDASRSKPARAQDALASVYSPSARLRART